MNEFINTVKPLFPVTWALDKIIKLEFKSNAELFTLLVQIGIYLVLNLVSGIVLGLIGIIPFLGFLTWAVGTLITLYCVVGIVLTVLDFLKVFEPKENKEDETK